MANPSKAKGDRGELEAAALLTEALGLLVRRKLGAGRADDTGDLDGVPGHVVQVANWADTAAAARVKPPAAEQQRINAQGFDSRAAIGASCLPWSSGRAISRPWG